MDPQSLSFTPRDDIWRFHADMLRVQQTQTEHAERLLRLERRQDDDARLKSVWGATSPFPSVLGGQVPLQQQPADSFSRFDDQSSNLISSLQLDADDEPRRIGATSRANSVRFDESANHGWAHASRSSIDLIPRTGSGLGGHAMTERSFSHKSDGRSDGRQSSAGHSVHSLPSGRANSLGLDIGYGTSHSMSNASPIEPPRLAPGLFLLGPVPAIIRCWLTTNFKHETLLYAAVCSGSFASLLDMRLISKLGYEHQVYADDQDRRRLKLAVYLPEAIPHPGSRPNTPTPQLPSVIVDFVVVENRDEDTSSKPIQIFLGSDMLRTCSADILFSSNTLTLFDEERSKLCIPLVRPEDDKIFKSLFVTSGGLSEQDMRAPISSKISQAENEPSNHMPKESYDPVITPASAVLGDTRPKTSEISQAVAREHTDSSQYDVAPLLGPTPISKPNGSPATWGNWRRESEKATSEWAASSTGSSGAYQRRDQGIKILKPAKLSSRSSSSHNVRRPTTPGGESHSFASDTSDISSKHPSTSESKSSLARDSSQTPSKPLSSNPVGGASAFSWLNANTILK